MKNFEEQWKHTLLRDTFKLIAETYWRLAYKSIRDEITANPVVGDGLANILDFIDRELGTKELNEKL